ncbi:MAG: hypothetical protein D5R99_09120, partial [Methanocalculus sp. MSAO_Arc1]|uniref:hypothetical protein n=1 Tax=Methanocalculus sp. MSAO_Arc1 TaxID=2293854 RepID=UPI000FF0ABF3
MTSQIPDTFLFKGKEYELIGMEGGMLVSPEILRHRQLSEYLTLVTPNAIEDIFMPAAGVDTKSLVNAWKKT